MIKKCKAKGSCRVLAFIAMLVLVLGLVPASASAQATGIASFAALADGGAAYGAEANVGTADKFVLKRVAAPAVISATDNTNDELLEGYIAQQFGAQLPGSDDALVATQSTAGSRLRGNEAMLYGKLRPWVEQVAAGTITDTKLRMSETDFDGKTDWTAAELGADALLDGEGLDPVAEAAFYDKIDQLVDYGTVINAVLSDCPYELYWYDKTIGITLFYEITVWEDSAGEHLGITEPYFALAVARDYADENYVPDEWEDGVTYAVRPGVGASVRTAVNAAADVALAHKDEPAYERLNSYKQEICDATSYNDAAANDEVAYGGPWQLLWVFDGDPGTSVVCEGYAKAFKYLCDLSGKNDVECLSATGYLFVSEGDEGEGHMWNVVRMPDGRNYLVDVTNCDDKSMCAHDELFLAANNGGSYADGYTFVADTPAGVALYVYDDDVRSVYPEADLTISSVAYDPGQNAPVVRQPIEPSVSIQGWTYGRAASAPALADGSNPGNGAVVYEYKVRGAADNTYAADAPVKAGDYTLRATIEQTDAFEGGTATTDFSIAKAVPVVGTVGAGTVVDNLDASKVVLNRSDASVAGTLSLDVAALELGERSYAWTFVPADSANYEVVHGTVAVTVTASITGATVVVANQVYVGTALVPEPTVTLGDKTLVAGTDYAVDYENNTNAGTAVVVVTGKGYYTGAVRKSFKIAKASNGVKASAAKATQALTYKTSAQSLAASKVFKVSGANGAVTYAKKSGNAGITVSAAGKVTAKKGLAAGTYKCVFTVKAAGDANHAAATKSVTVTFKVAKAANPMSVKAVARTASAAKARKAAVVVASPVSFSKKAVGKVTYARVAKGSSAALSVDARTGKITVRKGTKKGTYKVVVKVTAAGDANRKSATKTLTCKVTVK